MSQTDQQKQEQDKSMDKKEIAEEEEREKMLNAENMKHSGAAPAQDLEVDEHKPKRKIPVGGIKMPGFCRSKSKEPCKEDDAKPNETDGDAPAKDGDNGVATDKAASTPAKEPKEKEARRGIIQAIRLPLSNVSSVFSRKKKEADAELGTTGAAGLASVETLDDATQEKNNAATEEDAMDSVRLDAEAGDAPTKPLYYVTIIQAIRRNLSYCAAALVILLAFVIIITIACAGPRREPPSPVRDDKVISQASCGPVEGLVEEDAHVFRGIPYAIPPLGERRWQHSELINKLENCWNGTYLAHNASNVCWQRNRANNTIYGSEDCLYLDVFTPEVRFENPMPVVVLIGADTLSGPSPGIMLPSGKLAHVKEVVFVRPNFRLDVLGFLAAKPLSVAALKPSSGNYGLSDIINVLKWVQLNIEYFGGSKDLVTVWGHRAGGTLVTALLASPRAKGLFSQAWISSGSGQFPNEDLKTSEEMSKEFLERTRCSNADCLRNKRVEDIMNSVPLAWYAVNDGLPEKREDTLKKHKWLVKDGIFIRQHIGEVLRNQDTLPIKIVMGTTAYSGRLPEAVSRDNFDLTKEQVKQYLTNSLLGEKNVVDEAMQTYFDNSTLKKTPKETLHMMISDVRVVCPLMLLAKIRTDVPFYISNFTNNVNLTVDSDAGAILGFFPNVTPQQKRHLQAIQALFFHFVGNREIPQANNANRILTIDQDVNAQVDYENCNLWIKKDLSPFYARVD
ncbi:neurotactin [Copidosoma floridanum]|uniref:neurotactin n=1 Tax=Copidosoma floridanum TaxID=29053 RepID=UPI0006C97C54|nr:neurotactin [Copidosoma floridanum]